MKLKLLTLLIFLSLTGCSKPHVKMVTYLMPMQDDMPVLLLKSIPQPDAIMGKNVEDFLLEHSLSQANETRWMIQKIKDEKYQKIILSPSGHNGPLLAELENGRIVDCTEYKGALFRL